MDERYPSQAVQKSMRIPSYLGGLGIFQGFQIFLVLTLQRSVDSCVLIILNVWPGTFTKTLDVI